MSTIRNTVAALAVVAAVVLPATGAVAAESGSRTRTSPAAQSDLATAPSSQARASIVDLINIFTFCDDAKSEAMYPPSPYFVLDCMHGAPASNG